MSNAKQVWEQAEPRHRDRIYQSLLEQEHFCLECEANARVWSLDAVAEQYRRLADVYAAAAWMLGYAPKIDLAIASAEGPDNGR